MEFFSSQARYVAEQMRGMSLSQRIAVALLALVLIAGMWWLLAWSGQPPWTPLLDQSFSSEESHRVRSELRVAGIGSRVEGDRVLIQGGDGERQLAHAVLSERGALPADTSLAYANLVKDSSVFIGEERSRWMESRGLETELSAVLRRFEGIADARVLITVPQKRGFSRQQATSSASVALTMQGGAQLDKSRILAISHFVAGAVPGLQIANVKITDGQRFYRAPGAADRMPTEILELQQRVEDHYMQKVYDQLRHIGNVVVNVHAKLRTTSERSQKEVYGPPTVDEESATTEEMTGGTAAAEPAVRPNTRVGLTDASSSSRSIKEQTDTSLKGQRDVETTVTDEMRGSVERLSTSVSVPRSYLEAVIREKQGEDKDITAAAIDAAAAAELPRIRSLVKPLIDATQDDQVVVDWYYDMPQPAAKSQTSAEATGFLALARDYGPQAGLAVLAAASLFFMLRIARRAQMTIAPPKRPQPAGGVAGAWNPFGMAGFVGADGVMQTQDGPLATLSTGSSAIGEVQELGGLMVGHEVDEEMVRTQQIIQQVGQLVKEDAAGVAGIIQQWLQDSE
jgi:flagellar M-ring protein FliF